MAVVPWFVSGTNCVKEWCVTVTEVVGNWGILPWGIWISDKMHNMFYNIRNPVYKYKYVKPIPVGPVNSGSGSFSWENVTSVRLAASAGKRIRKNLFSDRQQTPDETQISNSILCLSRILVSALCRTRNWRECSKSLNVAKELNSFHSAC